MTRTTLSRSGEQTSDRSTEFRHGIVGRSRALQAALQNVKVVAPTTATVLIHGETGTGKELIARAIHNQSTRSDGAFVKIDCGAIPSGLLESELFGHERGAFTGAVARKIGRLELADGGTAFLDEVGDMPTDLQPKLLRMLQEHEFERLGGTQTRHLDIRIVAATCRDLPRMIRDGQFRSDLYYRLNVFPIELPPLRQRAGDIPFLVRHFVKKYASELERKVETVATRTMELFSRYQWPGNIRELENMIERAVILSTGKVLHSPAEEIEQSNQARSPEQTATLKEFEREHILKVLGERRWVVGGPNGAATVLGVKRTTLISKMEKLGIARARLFPRNAEAG